TLLDDRLSVDPLSVPFSVDRPREEHTMSFATPLNRRLFGLSALAALIGAVVRPVNSAAAATPAKKSAFGEQLPVAVLLAQGATVIAFAGRWEVFQDAEVPTVPGFRLFPVAPSHQPLRATAGLQLIPDYSFDDAPDARVIVLGAQGGNDNPAKLAWLRKA